MKSMFCPRLIWPWGVLLFASCDCPEPPQPPSDLTFFVEHVDEERPSVTWEVFMQSDLVTIIARDGDRQAVAVYRRQRAEGPDETGL